MKGFLSSRKKGLTVRFESCDYEATDAEFYKEFNKYNESSLWICLMYIMTCFVEFSLEIDDTIFDIASSREETCIFGPLAEIPWKPNETTAIFYPNLRSPCTMYNYNITELRNMTFNDAKETIAKRPKPTIIRCSTPLSARNFSWETSFIGTCRGAQYRRHIHGSKLVGIAIGSIFLGILADSFGRKIAIYIAVCLYIGGVIIQQLMHNFTVVLILTAFKGIGKAGLENIVLILFLEYCSKNNRAILVLYTRLLSPFGTIMGIHMKKHLNGFTPELRYIIAIPSVAFIFYVWYVPESPRWSLSYCRKEEAWNLLQSLGTPLSNLHLLENLRLNKLTVLRENLQNIFTNSKFIKTILLSIYLLFFLVTVSYMKKEYVTLKGHLSPFAHHNLLTMAKMFSFMNVLPPVIMFRRRFALLWFFMLITLQLSINLITNIKVFYILNILMMLNIYSVRNLLLLYICEIFPTCLRATSYGIINSIAMLLYFGNDVVGIVLYIKSLWLQNFTLLIGSTVALVIVNFLPEVRQEELPDYKRYRRDYENENK